MFNFIDYLNENENENAQLVFSTYIQGVSFDEKLKADHLNPYLVKAQIAEYRELGQPWESAVARALSSRHYKMEDLPARVLNIDLISLVGELYYFGVDYVEDKYSTPAYWIGRRLQLELLASIEKEKAEFTDLEGELELGFYTGARGIKSYIVSNFPFALEEYRRRNENSTKAAIDDL